MENGIRRSWMVLMALASVGGIAAPAYSQGTAEDQYKQMGGLAAIAKACYGSKAIPNKLSALARASVAKNPEIKDTLNALLGEYNAAFQKAGVDHRIWNGSQQDFGVRAYNCSNAEDMADIKRFEDLILQNMGAGAS